jgi:small subunit ribosomal protein S9
LDKEFYATGRRKTSIARVYLRPGSGKVEINKRELEDYFPRKTQHMIVRQPLVVTDSMTKYDIKIRVKGGGLSGQTDAILHGISRALSKADESNHGVLKRNGFLTRDSRMVERKKYGQPGARRKFQFSKR